MGTNHYVDADPTCDNPGHTETLHIGKSSGGWKFGFHGIPSHDPPLESWSAWQTFLEGRTITDEYGSPRSLAEFIELVEAKQKPSEARTPSCRVKEAFEGTRDYHDAEGYDFYDGDFS